MMVRGPDAFLQLELGGIIVAKQTKRARSGEGSCQAIVNGWLSHLLAPATSVNFPSGQVIHVVLPAFGWYWPEYNGTEPIKNCQQGACISPQHIWAPWTKEKPRDEPRPDTSQGCTGCRHCRPEISRICRQDSCNTDVKGYSENWYRRAGPD